MTAKASVFIATSLDGFISRPDGSIDWLEKLHATAPKGEDFGYKAFMATVDVLVMGRNTFEKVLTFTEWPYGDLRVVVLSSKPVAIPDAIKKTVSATTETPTTLMRRLSSEGVKHIYVDGGLTIQSFLRAGLISEFIITVIPVLLGVGRPLFGPLEADIKLTHVSTKAYACGFVQNRHCVLSKP